MMAHNTAVNNVQSEEIVRSYYLALKNGDLQSVKSLMTEQSYFMALESLGLKRAFKDPVFKQALEGMEEDPDSLKLVEEQLSMELLSRKLSQKIIIKHVESNGLERQTVHYTEDGKIKNLYFSREKDGWKINYYAGRKVD